MSRVSAAAPDRPHLPAPRGLPARLVPLVVLAVALLVGGPVHAQRQDGRPPFGVAEGMTGPDFTMMSLAGEPVTLSELRDGPVLLNFWASWCPPCVEELPLLDRAASELEGSLRVVLLNVGEPHDTVAPFLEGLGVAAPLVLRDARDEERPLPDGVVPSRSVAQVYQTFGLPTSLLLDERGVIRARVSGPVSDASLRALLARVGIAW
jgi:thiol-disulfide isomerase/thioredoxin